MSISLSKLKTDKFIINYTKNTQSISIHHTIKKNGTITLIDSQKQVSIQSPSYILSSSHLIYIIPFIQQHKDFYPTIHTTGCLFWLLHDLFHVFHNDFTYKLTDDPIHLLTINNYPRNVSMDIESIRLLQATKMLLHNNLQAYFFYFIRNKDTFKAIKEILQVPTKSYIDEYSYLHQLVNKNTSNDNQTTS